MGAITITAEKGVFASCHSMATQALCNSEEEVDFTWLLANFSRTCAFHVSNLVIETGMEEEEAEARVARAVDFITEAHVNGRPYGHFMPDWLDAALSLLLELSNPIYMRDWNDTPNALPYLNDLAQGLPRARQ